MFFSGGLIPTYLLINNLGLLDSMWAVILPGAFSVWNMIIARTYYQGIPRELREAADVDGASEMLYFFKILLPLLKPAIVTSAILKGVSTYNEYYMANLYLQDKTKYQVVATSLYVFSGPMGNQYNYICAGVIITIIPALIVFLLCQDQIYSGMAAGAVKG